MDKGGCRMCYVRASVQLCNNNNNDKKKNAAAWSTYCINGNDDENGTFRCCLIAKSFILFSIISKDQPQVGNFNIEISPFKLRLRISQMECKGRSEWWKCANGPVYFQFVFIVSKWAMVYRLANLKAAQIKRTNFHSFHQQIHSRFDETMNDERRQKKNQCQATTIRIHETLESVDRFRCAQCIKLIQKIAHKHTHKMPT